uniref:Ig-like domain-containing protein n=1 Tax=Lutzomyia longipalpis TaxID=7200 RepID=A0A1B0CE58_LUTLO
MEYVSKASKGRLRVGGPFGRLACKRYTVSEDPEFTDVIENITVPAGRNVKLACSVKNLGSYKVRDLIWAMFAYMLGMGKRDNIMPMD